MDLYKIIKRDTEKKSKLETFAKVMIVIGSVAAVGILVLALYKKWKECHCRDSEYDDFDDEWFCDCDECGDDSSAECDRFEPECMDCPDEAEVEYEEKEEKEI